MIIPLGGGGQKVVAAITVNYPSGSTCTCTLGSRVLTAKDTSGRWVFGLPSTGSWVVKATDGTNTATQTVSITTEGQVESVTLSLELVLFDGGDVTSVTGGWTYKITQQTNYASAVRADNLTVGTTLYWLPGRWWNSAGTNQANNSGYAYTKNTIDVTDYNTITAVSNCAQGNMTVGDASVALAVGTVTLDISALSGEYNVKLGDTLTNNCAKVEITKLYLS